MSAISRGEIANVIPWHPIGDAYDGLREATEPASRHLESMPNPEHLGEFVLTREDTIEINYGVEDHMGG